MKKNIIALFAAIAISHAASAQQWNMVITKADGSQISIPAADVSNVSFDQVALEDQNVDQVIIKEIYNGGCLDDNGAKYQYDKCIILYNNCPQKAVVNNLCFGFLDPANAYAKNKNYDEQGNLVYESQGFLPAWSGIWWFQQPLVIEPYTQVVVNVHGAIDNTQTVSQSVNYANADYYAMYDPESGYENTKYYPTPADVIPTSHYLKAKRYALGNAWSWSVAAPATILFQAKDTEPMAFAENADNYWYPGGEVGDVWTCLKVPTEWVVDGVEIYGASYDDNQKRLTSDVDMGYVFLTNYQGHSLYRNVDKEATEALPENAGKLVYGYDMGVGDSTDPSGINAEASIRNGAHIVYLDTNNSTADFHERQQCSLRDQ